MNHSSSSSVCREKCRPSSAGAVRSHSRPAAIWLPRKCRSRRQPSVRARSRVQPFARVSWTSATAARLRQGGRGNRWKIKGAARAAGKALTKKRTMLTKFASNGDRAATWLTASPVSTSRRLTSPGTR